MRSQKSIACHQPNFLPWMGFFAKVAACDIFVLLDDVQFTKGPNKHNWTTRVKILNSNDSIWLSLPVIRTGQGLQKICHLKTDKFNRRWLLKIIKTIDQSYKKTPYYDEIIPDIKKNLFEHKENICDTNFSLIKLITKKLDLKTQFVKSSKLNITATSTDRLI